ncbi:MAG: glycoside hydrolase family 3 C-terminal domain-containing protein [Verrucomicrobia bacterium]|nr:glycoside hydrolase family 3 C-terminal domain-containing protein [Verrucomicrobiota bacterium]
MNQIIYLFLLAVSFCFSVQADTVERLLEKMTLDEKIGQLNLYSSPWENTGPIEGRSYVSEVRSGLCGNILNLINVGHVRQMQRLAVEESRLGIPLLFGYDVIHGYKTIFPIPLGLASSWDMGAIEKAARIAAVEAAASGINWTYAPMVDIARDPRWGRIAEGAGEDTFLACEVAKANVRGFQGDDLAEISTIAACVKHFAAYGAAQAGRDYHTVDMSERMLRETYLPPFKAALDAGCVSVMTAFNELDGIPATANPFLLKTVLRDEWNFDGVVVTDYSSINEMLNHGSAADQADAAAQALVAGVDMDMMSSAYVYHLKQLLTEGRVTMDQIDESVRNVLRLKEKLGLFDDPYRYCDEQREQEKQYAKEHLDASYEIAGKSMVLLKNSNQLLPLDEGTRIALIGPLATARGDLLGTWGARGNWEMATSVLDAMSQLNGHDRVDYAQGCGVEGTDISGFAEAVALAAKNDVVVMVLGETAGMSGEASSRSRIGLPGVQSELLEAVAQTGKPIVVLLLNGRPLALEKEQAFADAILEAWHPGTEGGKAAADMLFGKLVPSAKLPVTFPRSLGQVPIHYNMKNTGRPQNPVDPFPYVSRYMDCPNDPLYPFGFGLSYTEFRYSEIRLDKAELKPGETLTASVTVSNVGDVDGEEVVQLYIQDLVGSVTRPVKELKGFKKILLKKGGSQTVEFRIGEKELTFLRRDMTWGTEPGDFKVFIGTNSRDVKTAVFTLR